MGIAAEGMVHDIADEEQRREAERHEHARSMGAHILVLDEIQTRAESDGAQTVQQCIEARQEDPLLRQGGRRTVYVEKP